MLTRIQTCLFLLFAFSVFGQQSALEFVKDGKMIDVIKEGAFWKEEEGAVVGTVKGSLLYAGKYIEPGDFTMKIRMSLDEINKTTALLWFFNNHFGFDSNYDDNGECNKLFMYSPVIDEVRYFGNSHDFFQPGVPFDFEVRHRDESMQFLINGQSVAVIADSLLKSPLRGSVGLRPWRNTIRIYDWTFEGSYRDFPDNDYVFERGEAGYNCFRIPAIVQTQKGTLLAFAEGRQNSCADNGDVDIVLKRSVDGGESWGALEVVWGDSINTCSYASPIVERTTGKIIVLSVWNRGEDHFKEIYAGTSVGTRRVFKQESVDDGLTWSEPEEITSSVKKEGWTYYGLGYTSLIQLERGEHRGRLVLSAYHGENLQDTNYVHLMYSDDLGKSWHLGGTCPRSGVNETEMVELPDGTIYLLMRNDNFQARKRLVTYSRDGGASISSPVHQTELGGTICQTSLTKYIPTQDSLWLIQTSPMNDWVRERMVCRISKDWGVSWMDVEEVYEGYSAYSDLIVLKDGSVKCLFEGGKVFAHGGILFKGIELNDSNY